MMLEEPGAAERRRNISMAKVGVGQAGRFVSQNAVQLHGGIGMTEEYAVGHYFRRVMVIEHTFGDTAHHLSRLADQVN
jgi:alkylation response protein AidB-like acyl-CoA dehydrogenase